MSLTDDIKYLEKLINRAFEGFKPCKLDLDAVDENGGSIFLNKLKGQINFMEKVGTAPLMAARAYAEGFPAQGFIPPIIECLTRLENNETYKKKCAANDWDTVKLMIMDAILLCPRFIPATYKNAYRALHPGDSGRGVTYNAGGKRKAHRRRSTKRRSTRKQRR